MRNLCILLVALCLLTNQACSDEKRGCTNPLAKNFKQVAESDCCCKYDEEIAVDKVLGTFRLIAKCNSGTSSYDIKISKIKTAADSINIYNLHNQQSNLGAHFLEGSFIGAKTIVTGACQLQQTVDMGLENKDLILTFNQKKTTGDCGFFIDIYCEGSGFRP